MNPVILGSRTVTVITHSGAGDVSGAQERPLVRYHGRPTEDKEAAPSGGDQISRIDFESRR